MPFTVGWYDTGILVDCTGSLDAEATDTLLRVVVAALDRCMNPTDLILDWRGCLGTPTHRRHCTQRVASLGHPRLGMVAVVDNDPTAIFQVKRMYQARDYPYLVCTSLQEAEFFLKGRAATVVQPDEPYQECPLKLDTSSGNSHLD